MADTSRDKSRSCSTTRRAYTLEFKLDVLKWMKKNSGSTRGTAKRFGIHRRMVQKWKGNEHELSQAFVANGAKRMKIRQQKQPLFQELEERLLHWFMGQRQSQPSDSSIKTCALSIAREIGLDSFKASPAWILSFKERHNNVGTLLSNNSTTTSLSDNELLSKHTPLNEPNILLHFTEGVHVASIQSSNLETFVYYDYQTPEHNYCTIIPMYSSDNYKMGDKQDPKEQVHGETVPVNDIVISTPIEDYYTNSVPPPLDIDGVLTLATRTYQPEFTICPELVLFGHNQNILS